MNYREGSNKKGKANYSQSLINEYKASRGFSSIDLGSFLFKDDVKRFIRERKESTDKYTRFLEGLTLDFHESDTIENIDCKEFLISNTCDFDTTVATSDKNIFDIVKRDRAIIGNIRIYNGIPTLAIRVNDGYHYSVIDNTHFKTIMKTNPRIESIRYFSRLKDVSGFNMIIGVNGNTFDCDMKSKIEAMNNLSSNLDDNYIRFQYEDEDDYIYIIASKELKRRK